MVRSIALIAAVIALSGCANSSEVYLPDGRKGYTLNCSGLARSWGACLEKAGDLCRERGYNIYARDATTGVITAVSADGYSASGFSGPLLQRELLIGCKT